MTKFDWIIIVLTVAAVLLFIYMIAEAVLGERAQRAKHERHLYFTYGRGYERAAARAAWQWEE